MSDALPEVERLQAVDLRPGDVLVATVAPGTRPLVAAALHERLKAVFPNNKSAVIGGGVELSVYRPEGSE